MDNIGISGVPKGSKLQIIGDWYRNPGECWKAVCYFYNELQGIDIRRSLPIDLLPTLIAGTYYPRNSAEHSTKGWTGTLTLPKISDWKKCHYKDIPKTLKRAGKYSKQLNNITIYRIEYDGRIHWIPAIEIARILFFHSSEITRAAVYQGNIWQLGKARHDEKIGNIDISENIPNRYLNSVQFRKFLTWLFFLKESERSFGSIFSNMNCNTKWVNNAEVWSFDFSPPNLAGCELSYLGFTEIGKTTQVYIREIKSISGVPSPELDVVYFSHPNDTILWQENDPDTQDADKLNNYKQQPKIEGIAPNAIPMPGPKKHFIKVGSTGFCFDVEPDLKRSPRHIQGLPPGSIPDLDSVEEQTPDELASLNEGVEEGSCLGVDVDNLDPPELIASPEKLNFFEALLDKLEEQYDWSFKRNIGTVPKKRCRSTHLINGQARRYCHAILERDETTIIQILEIELSNKPKKDGTLEPETLSTLIFRAPDTNTTFQLILDELMSNDKDTGVKAMAWKRKFNSKVTTAHTYLGHPDQKISSEEDALKSWVARAAEKILN